MDATQVRRSTVLTPEEIERLPVEALGHIPGVGNQVLWRDATSMQGILTIEGGHHLGAHAHRANHHHVGVLDGVARILGRELGPGSYVHIPAGVEHDMEAATDRPCRLLYAYVAPAG
ncbi:cupin domain-containing protein [Actinomarinicola tropica]|uniref:Cupin domain-containing protein n=1 Tax=Actinomarinicola tropica TaxID=2789776 RepID=A0A5Q2RND7_9ACTN|nr:cupin domain-containing protein [Actinomarinicola tropica]QGG96101.1 cupin domain-containing protein [Actinomarinicola tropica]